MRSTASQEKKVALITGAGGQDGAYLVELLRSLNYEIHALIRSPDSITKHWYSPIYHGVEFHYGSVTDAHLLKKILEDHPPDEIYNLAAQSHIANSWTEPVHTCDTNALGFIHLLEAVRECGLQQQSRIFQAGTSELFGHATISPQNEETSFAPTTPYATSKAFAFWTGRSYRENYGMFIVNGILFNHESLRRGDAFRTWKITQQVALVSRGKIPSMSIGNPQTRRDWGHVADFVRAMWLSLQHSEAEDYVFATGNSHSIKQFVEQAFRVCGIELRWTGEGLNETAQNSATSVTVVRIDPEDYLRPSHDTMGDPRKLEAATGWKRQKSFEDVVSEMTKAALDRTADI